MESEQRFSCVKKFYHKFCYSADTHNLMNYLSLKINNKEIHNAYTERMAQNFSTLFQPTLVLTIIATIYRVIEYIITNNPAQLCRLLATYVFLLIWFFANRKMKAYAPLVTFLVPLYMGIMPVIAFSSGGLPELLKDDL